MTVESTMHTKSPNVMYKQILNYESHNIHISFYKSYVYLANIFKLLN